MKNDFRTKCPITTALDIVGDKWSLVVIKQMLYEQKSTFKQFTESNEAIATNILTARLKMLESFQIIEKQQLETNKKTNIYTLTPKGLAFAPILLEMMIWSKHNVQEFNPDLNLDARLGSAEKNKAEAISQAITNYQNYKAAILKTDTK